MIHKCLMLLVEKKRAVLKIGIGLGFGICLSILSMLGASTESASIEIEEISGYELAQMPSMEVEPIVEPVETEPPNVEPVEVNMNLIAIDAGHGGSDPGCEHGGVLEKDVNLKIALMLEQELLERAFEVYMIRREDINISKYDRAKLANAAGAGLLVSIHQNSTETSAPSGIETWYDKNADDGSSRLAQLIHKRVIKNTGARDRGLNAGSELVILRDAAMPACLIETGFMSNESELAILQDENYQQKIVTAIADGIDAYLNPKILYLTMDDGPSARTTGAILDILHERNIKATFFVIGENVRKNPELARRIVDEGHAVGIHCDNHDYRILYASVESYLADFYKAYDSVVEIMGVTPELFRFPGGSVNSHNRHVYLDIIEEMTNLGFIYFDWNASIEDAVVNPRPEKLLQNAKNSVKNKSRVVLLAHDTSPVTVEILNDLLDMLDDYEFEVLTSDVTPIKFALP